MLNLILPPTDRRIGTELDALSLEIFATTYGADWAAADALADAQLPALLDYAQAWDCAALAAGNPVAECPF
jgi:hypothetical protein